MAREPCSQDLERAKKGDRAAFDALFAEHATSIRLFVRHRMGPKLRSAMESIDLIQDVYLEAFKSFAGFDGRDSGDLLRWLRGIASHRMSDRRRWEEAGRKDLLQRASERVAELLESHEPAPLEPALQRAIEARVDRFRR